MAAFQGIYSVYEKYDVLFDFECMDWVLGVLFFSREKKKKKKTEWDTGTPHVLPFLLAPPRHFFIFKPLVKSVKYLLFIT